MKVNAYYTSAHIVRGKRRSLGLTMKDVSYITGMPTSNISSYETGAIEMGPKVALKFALALNMDMLDILFPTGDIQSFKEYLDIKNRSVKFLGEDYEK